MNSNSKFKAKAVPIVSIKCKSEPLEKTKRNCMRLSTILKPKFKEETYNSKNSVKKMHFWKAIKTEKINNISHFMTLRDNWKIF
jgi:hypothetical protein